LCTALAASWPANAATHASLQLAPSSVTLSSAHAIGQMIMSSLDARDLIFDVEVTAWQQQGDTETFPPTTDLIVIPPVYDVEPFQRSLIRIALRDKAEEPATERAFQVWFREVLPARATRKPRTLTAAVFIAPPEPTGEVRYELERVGPKEARLTVHDESNVHAYIGELRIASGGHDVFKGRLEAYVLAGNSRAFLLKLAQPIESDEAELVIRAGNEETTVNVSVR
jgi:fimbrial chaperone protein